MLPSLLLALLALALPATLGAQAGNPQRTLERADALAKAGKLQQARALYESALAEGANLAADPGRARNLGMAYYKAKPPKYDEAARWLGNAWRLKPGGEMLRFALADSLRQTRQYEDALGHYAELTEARPLVEEYAVGYALCLDRLGRSDEGAAHLAAFLKRAPDDRSARMEYAGILVSAKRYDDALDQYQMILKRNPKSLDAMAAIARVHSWRREYAEATAPAGSSSPAAERWCCSTCPRSVRRCSAHSVARSPSAAPSACRAAAPIPWMRGSSSRHVARSSS
jgi:tetratricopeptide (TPR) repeat protein